MHKCSGKMVLKPDFKEFLSSEGRESDPLNLDLVKYCLHGNVNTPVLLKGRSTSLPDHVGSPNRFEIMLDHLSPFVGKRW